MAAARQSIDCRTIDSAAAATSCVRQARQAPGRRPGEIRCVALRTSRHASTHTIVAALASDEDDAENENDFPLSLAATAAGSASVQTKSKDNTAQHFRAPAGLEAVPTKRPSRRRVFGAAPAGQRDAIKADGFALDWSSSRLPIRHLCWRCLVKCHLFLCVCVCVCVRARALAAPCATGSHHPPPQRLPRRRLLFQLQIVPRSLRTTLLQSF